MDLPQAHALCMEKASSESCGEYVIQLFDQKIRTSSSKRLGGSI